MGNLRKRFALQEEEQGSARTGLATTFKAIRMAPDSAPAKPGALPGYNRGFLRPSNLLGPQQYTAPRLQRFPPGIEFTDTARPTRK